MAEVIAFMDDLMFLSRIREAAKAQGVEVKSLRAAADLVTACRAGARLVFMDLDSARVPALDGLAALRADPALAAVPVVGFFGHVHADRAREAQAAGCTKVLSRGAFVQELGSLLAG